MAAGGLHGPGVVSDLQKPGHGLVEKQFLPGQRQLHLGVHGNPLPPLGRLSQAAVALRGPEYPLVLHRNLIHQGVDLRLAQSAPQSHGAVVAGDLPDQLAADQHRMPPVPAADRTGRGSRALEQFVHRPGQKQRVLGRKHQGAVAEPFQVLKPHADAVEHLSALIPVVAQADHLKLGNVLFQLIPLFSGDHHHRVHPGLL